MKVGDMLHLSDFRSPKGNMGIYGCPECGNATGVAPATWACGLQVKDSVTGGYEVVTVCSKATTVVFTAQKPKAGDVVDVKLIPCYSPGNCCPFCGEKDWSNNPKTGVGWACGCDGQWNSSGGVYESYTVRTPWPRYNPMPTNLKVGDVIAPMVPIVMGGNCPVCGETRYLGDTFLCGGKGSWLAGKKNAEYRIIKLCSKVGGVAPMPAGVLSTYREPVPTTCTCSTLLGGCTCGAFQREKDDEIRRLALSKLTDTERKVLGVG